MSAIDRHERLRKPGTTVSYEGFTKPLETGESLSLKVEILDPNNVLDESNERNNARIRHLACAKELNKPLRSVQAKPYTKMEETPRPRLRPDLTIEMMNIEPANPRTSDTIRFSAMVTNIGYRAAPRSEARIRIDKEANPGSISKPMLTPNSSTAIVRNLKVEKSGKHRVFFMADVNKDVSESDETNNVTFLDFTVLEASLQALPAGDELEQTVPAGIDASLARGFPFQITDEDLRRNVDPNNTSFTVQLEASKDFDPSTVTLGAIQAVVQLFDGNGLQSQNSLSGQIDAVSGNMLRWQSPQTEYASLCAPSSQNYCKLHFFLHDSVHAQDGQQLDGDEDGQPGGLYRKTFDIQTVQFVPNP